MSTRYVMGVDGGGSGVRAVICTPSLEVLGEGHGSTANPGVVGLEQAERNIQTAMRAALAAAALPAEAVEAVGLGIAGASIYHYDAADWLRQVARGVLPRAQVVPSSDFEIALVGALGRRLGVLVLAGTGSLAYGVNAAGEAALVGGWGYLLDDAGSGYWLGMRGLRAVVHADDGQGPPTALTERLLGALRLERPRDLVLWLYRAETPRTREIAALAPLVLQAAAEGDHVAGKLIAEACDTLTALAHTVIRRLALRKPPIAFAGGLLRAPNPLSACLCANLGLDERPQPRYTPAVGAALLALGTRAANS